MMQVENIQNLIYIDGSFYRIRTDAAPTEGSTALMTSGDIYTALMQFAPFRGINVSDKIVGPTGSYTDGINYMSNTDVPTVSAVYKFVTEYVASKLP